jgi:Sir2- and TIR-associating SLOG family
LYSLAEDIGRWIGESGRDLVSGAGLLIGSATIAGFLGALRNGAGWDLNRRLITRPFPQPLAGHAPDTAQWRALRGELARQAGVVIFLGGAKFNGADLVPAHGVREEFEIAKAGGAFLLPVAATGGAAQEISDSLVGSGLLALGPDAVRPTDDELVVLSDPATDRQTILEQITKIFDRLNKKL